ncbi:MAG TPA: hypothetical protein VNG31_00940 [Candidatus Baltobacteraceae bacterium]|nr:hypothetical protein [Candidatus Baltobacteraceae bacterium]
MVVRDLRAPPDALELSLLPSGARVQWRAALRADELETVARWVAARERAAIRLYASACAQLEALSRWPLEQLTLDARTIPSAVPQIAFVSDLTLESVPGDLRAVVDAFPSLQALRIFGRGAAIDASALRDARKLAHLSIASARVEGVHALTHLPLRSIELRDLTIDAGDLDAVLRLPRLRALRLARIESVRRLDALRAHPQLAVLSLDGLLHLDDVSVVATLPRLESLSMHGLWQLALDEVDFIPQMTSLRRLTLDIGGRRKNVEIYKRKPLPRALPFEAAR